MKHINLLSATVLGLVLSACTTVSPSHTFSSEHHTTNLPNGAVKMLVVGSSIDPATKERQCTYKQYEKDFTDGQTISVNLPQGEQFCPRYAIYSPQDGQIIDYVRYE